MTRLRPFLANATLALASLTAGALLVEGAARVAAWRATLSPEGESERPLSRYQPRLGWEKVPGAERVLIRPEFRMTLAINAHGLRGPDRDHAKPPGTRRVLVLGDSFAEGYYAEEPETLRAVLEGLLGATPGCGRVEVLNGGTMGYSTDQEYLFFTDEGRRYAPDVVLLLFYYNDVVYNVRATGPSGESKPWFDLGPDGLVLRNVPVPPPEAGVRNRQNPGANAPRPWRGSVALRLLSNRTVDAAPRLHRALSRLGLVEPVSAEAPAELWPYGPGHRSEVEDMWRRTEAILGALSASVRASGGRLAVLYVPARFEVDDAVWDLTRERYRFGRRWDREAVPDRLRRACASLGVPFVDPGDAIRRAERTGPPAYYTRDVHWTGAGNALAAHAALPTVAAAACGPAPGN